MIDGSRTYAEVERRLRRHGFAALRHSGDHAIWGGGSLRVSVKQGDPTEQVPPNTLRMMQLQATGRQPARWEGV